MDHENPLSNPLVAKAYREFSSKRQAEYKTQRQDVIQQLTQALDQLNHDKIADAKAVISEQLYTSQRQDYEDSIASAETILNAAKDTDGLAWLAEELTETKAKLAALL